MVHRTARRFACVPKAMRLALTLRGEIEAASTSHVTVKAGDAVAAEFDVERIVFARR